MPEEQTHERLLNVDVLPRKGEYVCLDGTRIDLERFFDKILLVGAALKTIDLAGCPLRLGFAMTVPMGVKVRGGHPPFPFDHWDEPEKFVFMTHGWEGTGDEEDRERAKRVADAVRMMRPVLRTPAPAEDEPQFPPWCDSTLDMIVSGPQHFQDEIEAGARPDGTFPWGDLRQAGATMAFMGDASIVIACAGYANPHDNHVLATLAGMCFLRQVLRHSNTSA